MKKNLLTFILANFWRLFLCLALFALGILWALFGVTRTAVILCLALLGYLAGTWLDKGRPGRVFRSLGKWMDRESD